MEVYRITDRAAKEQTAREILEALTDWFEVPETREAYIRESREQVFFAAEQDERTTGFLCLKETGRSTVELAVMGVRKESHRQGAGKALVQAAKEYAAAAGYDFMQVKTVQMGRYEDYDRTNRFYLDVGFRELEVLPAYWDEANPCQIYVMSLKNAINTISTRHSYRGEFLQESVPEEDLLTIAKAGLDAPSGCNKQTTDLIIVNDSDMLNKIKAQLDPPVAQTAPAMIVVLTRRINAYRDKCFAVQDYSAAIENMLLAIVELGYQSCWYEGHITDDDRICDKIAAVLNIPEEYDVVCILPVGKAKDDFHAPSKKPLTERVRFNRWSQ